MNRKYSYFIFIIVLLLAISVVGCSKSPIKEKVKVNDEPEGVTIKISAYDIFGQEEAFQKYYAEPLAEVYPHITLETVSVGLHDIEDHLLKGTAPDIFVGWNGDLPELIDLELTTNIMPYIEETGSDLDRFIEETIDSMIVDGELYGLPYARQFNALFYNKDIFDTFGVAYPKDGMTWQETIELAKQVTGERNGVDYLGLSPGGVWRLLGPFSLVSLIEYGTLNNLVVEKRDELVSILETAKQIYEIHGNKPDDMVAHLQGEAGISEFAQGSVAMLASLNRMSSFTEVNWGVAQYPSFPEVPNTYEAVDAHYYFLLSSSEHPEEAFQVMDFLSSYDSQKRLASEANRFPVLDDTSLMEEFAKGNEYIGDIDFSGVFKSAPAEQSILHVSTYDVQAIFTQKVIEMIEEGKDINTVLSELEQEVDIIIEDYKGSK